MFYQEVFDVLSRNKVRYLVVGGVAVNLHGVPRMTYDLDLMIALDAENVHRTWKALTETGFTPRAPFTEEDLVNSEKRKQLHQEKNMLVASFFKGEGKFDVVDIFVENPVDFESCYKNRKSYKLGDAEVTVMDIPDLIRLKTLAKRKQDDDDIESLRKLSNV